MNHPQAAQRPQMSAGSSIPWSEEAEAALRARIASLWAVCWFLIIGGFLFVIAGEIRRSVVLAIVGALCWVLDILVAQALLQRRMELGEEMRQLPNGNFFEGSGMLANKPRTTYRLTTWRQHPSDEQNFHCICEARALPGPRRDRPYRWEFDATWIPNYDPQQFGDELEPGVAVDPYGGRYVILCPCGIGHYKLKA